MTPLAAAAIFVLATALLATILKIHLLAHRAAEAEEKAKINLQLKIETGWRVLAMSEFIASIWPEHLHEMAWSGDPAYMLMRSPSKDHRSVFTKYASTGFVDGSDSSRAQVRRKTHPLSVALADTMEHAQRAQSLIVGRMGDCKTIYVIPDEMLACLDDTPFAKQVAGDMAQLLVRATGAHHRKERYG